MNRVRNLTMVFLLAVWGIYVGMAIGRSEKVELWLWGVPTGAFLALYRSRENPDAEGDSEGEDNDGPRLPHRRRELGDARSAGRRDTPDDGG